MTGDPLFSESVLLRQSGKAVFERGAAYAAKDAVEFVSVRPDEVRGRVYGSEVYLVRVRPPGDWAACTCPAFEREGYCKHVVAVALRANRAPAAEIEAVGAGAAELRAHLVGLGAEALADRLMRLAEDDDDLRRDLHMEAGLARGSDAEILATLRRALEDAIRVDGRVDYRGAKTYRAGVEPVLDRLAALADGPRAALALTLAAEALDLLEAERDMVDGHDGTVEGLHQRAADIHLAAARHVRPDPVDLAAWLFREETESELETFAAASETYAEVLGEAGLAIYRRLAEAARARGETGYALDAILDRFLARDGDVDGRIALRRAKLETAWDYHRLVDFCIGAKRPEQALEYAEEGIWRFEGKQQDEGLVLLCARLLREAGRLDEALARLEAAFAQTPRLVLYREIRSHGGDAARDRALAVLERRAAEGARGRWLESPVDALVQALLEEGLVDRAWAAFDRARCSRWTTDALACALEGVRPDRALALHAERVEALADQGGNNAYDEVAALVARMATLRAPAEQAAYLADLKRRWKAKRNLMTRLP
ncbi:SWIM zinc finger family protein [Salinarimonas chemoclinalis]|uniref:SWIM zinc finger family protein n=1 Tax=Salinarimonas chemoclinalis TaxID=3241599 RepID=UPI003556FBC8